MKRNSLTSSLDILLRSHGDGPAASWIAGSAARDELAEWCKDSLVDGHHLVDVAALLHRRLRATLADLEQLGLPADVIERFPRWRTGSRAGFRPPASGLLVAATTADDPVRSLRVHLSPGASSIPYAFVLLRSLLRRLPSVELALVVEPKAGMRELERILAGFGARQARRVRVVALPSATVFARDNALAMRDRTGAPALLIPRAFGQESHREEDALSPERAAETLEVKVVRSALCWEGGNILCDGSSLLLGVDTVRENMVRLGLTRAEVLAMLTAELGATPTLLGDLEASGWDRETRRVVSGQADFHIDLDLAPLGRFGRRRKPVALISDVVRGLELSMVATGHAPLIRGSFLSPAETAEILAEQYDEHARERHPKLLAYCDKLEQLGYRVIGVPDLRIAHEDSIYSVSNPDFGYCNVLPGQVGGRPGVYYLPWGIRGLDRAAEEQFRSAGLEPARVSGSGALANKFMRLRGGLHCLCGPWR